jgi:dCTP deaminase
LILTDREIKTAIDRGSIIIDPPPIDKHYSSTSVDLTLDPILTLFDKEKINKKGVKYLFDPSVDNFDAESILADFSTPEEMSGEGYELGKGDFVLGFTAEKIDLRRDTKIAARVEGKSSLARLGLSIHITAPTIHAGFVGRIRLEIVNHGHLPIILKKRMRICQLIFEVTLGTPTKGYSERGGQFLHQAPKPAR